MGDFSKFIVKAYLRKALTVLGTYLLTHGVLTESEAQGFVAAHIDELLGAVLLAASGMWTFLYQRYVKNKIVTALALPEGSSPAELKVALDEKNGGGF